jgi:GT2 family glycosyltransferase
MSVAAPPALASRVSVVICAFTAERWHELRSCVDSVLTQDPAPHEVIVTIDHDDELLALARAELGLRGVEVVPSTGAPGLSGARNTGAGRASGDVVAFIDDDARAQPGWLAAIADAHSRAGVLGTGGLVEPSWSGAAPGWLPPELGWVVGCSYRGLPEAVAPIRNPIGASMSFTRAVLEEAGGFDEGLGRVRDLPRSCEDTELGIRVRRMHPGGEVLHLPRARVLHTVPASRATWRYLARRCWTEGRAKAALARVTGSEAALASERRYASRVLPIAFARGLREAARGDDDGLTRSAAIVAALAITSAGYAFGKVRR